MPFYGEIYDIVRAHVQSQIWKPIPIRKDCDKHRWLIDETVDVNAPCEECEWEEKFGINKEKQ